MQLEVMESAEVGRRAPFTCSDVVVTAPKSSVSVLDGGQNTADRDDTFTR